MNKIIVDPTIHVETIRFLINVLEAYEKERCEDYQMMLGAMEDEVDCR